MKSFVRFDGRLVSYEGMSQETIVAMLTEQGLVPEFVDESIYLSAVASLQADFQAYKSSHP